MQNRCNSYQWIFHWNIQIQPYCFYLLIHEIEIQKIAAFSDIQFFTKNLLFFRCSVCKYGIQNIFNGIVSYIMENELIENFIPTLRGYFGSCLKRTRVNSPPLLFRRNYKWYEFFSMYEIMILAMDIEQLKRFWNKNKFSDFFNFWWRRITLSKNLNKEKHGQSENKEFDSLEKVICLLL